ncbi:MAG TPA: aminotransferase class I/II-fold pyridoxal phosphate-dependent enzyme [Vicinamibacterales bacterium]|nr:aminotransferase class I/II-fold pyridoxal phosphate-dependent enzyme [Vicinamibacterales bacterium]
MKRIYLSPPHLFGNEQALVADAFESNWIAPLGPHVDAFEREFAGVVEVPHAVALSSGTAAIHLALELLGVGPGGHVVCSSLTFSGSANPIRYQGATPIFVDCDTTWTIDPNLLEDALKRNASAGRRTGAVIAVDLYGQCADYDAIVTICDRYGVPLVEDAAEALGSTYGNRPAGGFGRIGIFSFNGNKIITTSGGGMLVSGEKTLVDRARFLATQARDPAPHYEHSHIGYNYRLSNVLAAIGRGQLKTLHERVEMRRAIFDRYVAGLGRLPGLEFMPEASFGRSNRWLTCLTVDPSRFGVDRETIRLALEAVNIEARPVWKPMHLQPVFAGAMTVGGEVSEGLFRDGLCLPSGSNLTPDEQARVIQVVSGLCRTLAG